MVELTYSTPHSTLVSCNQIAFFFFGDWTGKKGSGAMPALFLCRNPPSLGRLLIGVNEGFARKTS